MKILLDTHIFLWWADNPRNLSSGIINLIKNPKNEIYLSMVSLWEIQIKVSLGKLKLSMNIKDLVELQKDKNYFRLMSIKEDHIYHLALLPMIHSDPFDRLLIAQAVTEKMSIISMDSQIKKYPIAVL
ncbi:MAG: type II toxin-antitoxin system VapC family toxin [Ignavibacteriaceae bacterium]|nr:type II toxin-antitoxin system VapC family toxin [Ignavibacteriaceae bacterium]